MKKVLHSWRGMAIACGLAVFAVAGTASAEDPDATKLIAEKSCKMCHAMAKKGDQWGVLANGPHAKAFELLKSEEAKAAGAKVGVEDPSTSGKCLKCHSAAYAFTETQATTEITPEEGVTCQACHGPAADYKSKHGKDVATAKAELGLITPTVETCLRCHNDQSPTHKDDRYTTVDGKKVHFDFEQAAKKIAHPKPE